MNGAQHAPDLEREIATVVARYRHTPTAREMARTFRCRDGEFCQLVGLVEDCRRAVVWHRPTWQLAAIRFAAAGMALEQSTLLEYADDVDSVEDFVERQGEGWWNWVHPRYRWRLE
jgi:hypothetical protein